MHDLQAIFFEKQKSYTQDFIPIFQIFQTIFKQGWVEHTGQKNLIPMRKYIAGKNIFCSNILDKIWGKRIFEIVV